MKALIQIMLVVIFFICLYLFTGNRPNENEVLEGPDDKAIVIPTNETEITNSEVIERPMDGVSLYIGEKQDVIIKEFGKPAKYMASAYGFEWWIYQTLGQLIMFGIEDGKVVQLYTNSAQFDEGPYTIGQSIDDIFRMTIIENEISVNIGENVYLFMMNKEDFKSRLLVGFEDLYAQLYIDKTTNTLAGVRYMSGEMLIKQQPYEMQYFGELMAKPQISSSEQMIINEENAALLGILVNEFRNQQQLPPLIADPALNTLAQRHSEDMYTENYVSHDSPKNGTLKERLINESITYKHAGENVATGYYDAIEALHGLMNSGDHRNEILSKSYSRMGLGVFIKYYTQIFIEQ